MMRGVLGRWFDRTRPRAVAVTDARLEIAPAPRRTACYAPSMQLHLKPDGIVDACCTSTHVLGRIGDDSLTDIWNGAEIRQLRERLRSHDYRMGCRGCELEVELEGRTGSIPAQYDCYEPEVGEQAAIWPKKIDFMLSNACNLQCLQCSGEFSSAIRSRREGRPPLVSPYGAEFFEDLRAFIPHLEEATFEGGEPFLSELNYRVWRLIEELNPGLRCVVTTNATTLTPRVRRVMDRLQMGVIVSLDGATRETYERIRVGASFDTVLANSRELIGAAQSRGLPASINFCMMPNNYRDFEPLLHLADGLGVEVNVSVVRGPEHLSIFQLPQARIDEVVSHFDSRDESCRANLTINSTTWTRETGRVRRWAEVDASVLDRARRRHIHFFERSVVVEDDASSASSVEAAVRSRANERAAGAEVYELTVGFGDRILTCPPGLDAVLGPAAVGLQGEAIDRLGELVTATYGSYDPELVTWDAHQAEYVADLGGRSAHCNMAAIRDDRGELQSVKLFLSVGSATTRTQ